MPDFGIGEAVVGLGDVLGFGDVLGLGSALGFGGDAAAATGAATIGAGAGGAATAGGLEGIVGTGAGLFGGTTGLEGTLLAGGAPGIEAALGAGAAGGALGTAESFLGAPAASGFNPAALSSSFDAALPAASAATSGTGTLPGLSPSGSVFGSPTATPGVASTGPATTSALPGLQAAGPAGPAAPTGAVAPAGAGASDLTSAAGSGAAAKPGFLDDLVSGAAKNAVPAAIAGGGLLYNALKGGGAGATAFPSGSALNTQAAGLAKDAPQLMQYLTSGTVPAGMQASLDKASQDAKTAAVSKAASSGQPTDPAKNSTLGAEFAQIDQQKIITTAQLGQQLLTSGLSEAQLSASDYQTLLAADQSQQKQISDSIANFAKALGGMGGGINLKMA